jgi:hypothetical protein
MGAAAAPTSYRIGAKPIRSTRHNPELGIRPVKSGSRKVTAEVRATRHILFGRAAFTFAPNREENVLTQTKILSRAHRRPFSLHFI